MKFKLPKKLQTPLTRTFCVMVDPRYFEVDRLKEATFTIPSEQIKDWSVSDLTKAFYDDVCLHFKPKSMAVLPWFETTEK